MNPQIKEEEMLVYSKKQKVNFIMKVPKLTISLFTNFNWPTKVKVPLHCYGTYSFIIPNPKFKIYKKRKKEMLANVSNKKALKCKVSKYTFETNYFVTQTQISWILK